METNRRRWTLAWAGALLLVAGLLALLLADRSPEAGDSVAVTQAAPGAGQSPRPQAMERARGVTGTAQAGPPAPAEPPVIHSITVEKQSVCQMEENLITVHASAPDVRDDAYLRYVVHGHEGRSVPLKVDRSQAELPLEVTVYGRDGTVATARIPRFEVRDCWVEDELVLFRGQVAGKPDVVRFEAQVHHNAPPVPAVPGEPEPVPQLESNRRPVKYRWTFSTGTTVDTTEPWLEQDLGGRPQDALFSQVLLTCEAFDASGRTLVARHALQLRNPDVESLLREGIVRVHAEVEVGAAGVSPEGVVTQPVRLWHRQPWPVTLHSVKIRRLHRETLDQAMEDDLRRLQPEEAHLQAVFSGPAVVPPEGLTVTLQFASGGDARPVAQEYLLEGSSADRRVARGTFTLMRPDLPAMTRRMLADEAYRARVLRARAFLGKAEVTEEEVQGLLKHEDGVYADLEADEGPPAAGAVTAAERRAAGEGDTLRFRQ